MLTSLGVPLLVVEMPSQLIWLKVNLLHALVDIVSVFIAKKKLTSPLPVSKSEIGKRRFKTNLKLKTGFLLTLKTVLSVNPLLKRTVAVIIWPAACVLTSFAGYVYVIGRDIMTSILVIVIKRTRKSQRRTNTKKRTRKNNTEWPSKDISTFIPDFRITIVLELLKRFVKKLTKNAIPPRNWINGCSG